VEICFALIVEKKWFRKSNTYSNSSGRRMAGL